MDNNAPGVTLISRSGDLAEYLATNSEAAETFMNGVVAAYRALKGLSTNPKDWKLVTEKERTGNARAIRKRG